MTVVHDPATSSAVEAAMNVMQRHMAALNARDEAALVATLHFPHYRLSGGVLQTWQRSEGYLANFFARAGDGWAQSRWDSIGVIAAGPDKVHLDVSFTRMRADGSSLGSFRSLWVVARIDGRWAAQLRSSFAA